MLSGAASPTHRGMGLATSHHGLTAALRGVTRSCLVYRGAAITHKLGADRCNRPCYTPGIVYLGYTVACYAGTGGGSVSVFKSASVFGIWVAFSSRFGIRYRYFRYRDSCSVFRYTVPPIINWDSEIRDAEGVSYSTVWKSNPLPAADWRSASVLSSIVGVCEPLSLQSYTILHYWRYVALVVVLWCPALSSASVTALSKCTCVIFGVSIGLDPG